MTDEIKISSVAGARIVLDSGTIITYKNEQIAFIVSMKDYSLTISISFVINDRIPKFFVETNPIESTNTVEVICSNFQDKAAGGSLLHPLHIANYQGKKIYLSFVVRNIGDNLEVKIFDYTFYKSP